MNKKLTLQMLKDMEPGIFAEGEIADNPEGINMTNSGHILRWVAVRGEIHDWAIYCQGAINDFEWVKRFGDKIQSKENIMKLVPCDKEAFDMYRY